jgi:formate dehydrogenase subunit delta
MDIDNLIHMANRIGQFFESFSDKAEARAGIAQHIAKFWEPRMREALMTQIDTGTTATLLPLVREAVLEHRTSLQRRTAAIG